MYVSQVPNTMTPGPSPFRVSHWARLLVLVLAGTMVLQSGPVRVLVQQVRQVQVQHTCHHCANGVCPRDRETPCSCAHSGPAESETDGLLLRSCNEETPGALAPVSGPKWRVSGIVSTLAPRLSDAGYTSLYQPLTPQRLGDEVFRPPRTAPPARLT